jgi:hypothetical protein
MMLDIHLASLLLAVPLADDAVVHRFHDQTSDDARDALASWLRNCEAVGWIGLDALNVDSETGNLAAKLSYPQVGMMTFWVRPSEEEIRLLLERLSSGDWSGGCHVLVAPTNSVDQIFAGTSGIAVGTGGEGVVAIPDSWAAAMTVEHMRPLLFSQTSAADRWRSGPVSTSPYFAEDAEADLDSAGLGIGRSSSRARSLSNILAEDTTAYEERLRNLKQEMVPVEGTVLLASVFLPPVTHCEDAVERFYSRTFGARDESLQLIRERYIWERHQFEEHIRRFRRIDIIDRGTLREYLRAPEYYQMPLTVDELRCQIDNVLDLLSYENYLMCLCPESIDMSFELRGGRLRIRTDRRNKAQPRQGRVSSITFDRPAIAEIFEREFWTLFRLTEAEFKNKSHVMDWLVTEAAYYQRELCARA